MTALQHLYCATKELVVGQNRGSNSPADGQCPSTVNIARHGIKLSVCIQACQTLHARALSGADICACKMASNDLCQVYANRFKAAHDYAVVGCNNAWEKCSASM